MGPESPNGCSDPSRDHGQPRKRPSSGFVTYHSDPHLRNDRSRASVWVWDKCAQDGVELSPLTSDLAEYAAVKLRYGGRDIAVVSVYVRLGLQHMWDPHDLIAVCQKCSGAVIVCGEFNAHHITWGSPKTDSWGASLLYITFNRNLTALKDGSTTFARPGVESSVLNLTYASTGTRFGWRLQPDAAKAIISIYYLFLLCIIPAFFGRTG